MRRTERHKEAIQRRVGRTIDRRRAALGVEVEPLARAADIDLSQMVKVLSGKAGLSLYSLDRVARALGWTLGELAWAAFPPRKRPASFAHP